MSVQFVQGLNNLTKPTSRNSGLTRVVGRNFVMPKPFATVLIDTHNHEAFIAEAIQSILQQDFPASDTEILIVDDGSTDRTAEVAHTFEPRVRLLRKENGGQASAFNVGIPECKGEIIAFLDGDDWWAPGKLTAVVNVFSTEPAVGLVGHGITVVYSDGRRYTESPRESLRFRIASPEDARMFGTLRGFFGTSRMAYRKDILRQIGPVPQTLKFEADEYLFTLAALLADVVVLREPLTFYRLHDKNLFQIANADLQSVRRKQEVLATLAQSLDKRLKDDEVPKKIARIIVDCVQTEADVLRLVVNSGFPWETVSTELKIQRIFHSDASLWQQLFTCARLFPAFVMPAATYYRCRRWLSSRGFYKNLRTRFFPFPMPGHVERQEKAGPRGARSGS